MQLPVPLEQPKPHAEDEIRIPLRGKASSGSLHQVQPGQQFPALGILRDFHGCRPQPSIPPVHQDLLPLPQKPQDRSRQQFIEPVPVLLPRLTVSLQIQTKHSLPPLLLFLFFYQRLPCPCAQLPMDMPGGIAFPVFPHLKDPSASGWRGSSCPVCLRFPAMAVLRKPDVQRLLPRKDHHPHFMGRLFPHPPQGKIIVYPESLQMQPDRPAIFRPDPKYRLPAVSIQPFPPLSLPIAVPYQKSHAARGELPAMLQGQLAGNRLPLYRRHGLPLESRLHPPPANTVLDSQEQQKKRLSHSKRHQGRIPVHSGHIYQKEGKQKKKHSFHGHGSLLFPFAISRNLKIPSSSESQASLLKNLKIFFNDFYKWFHN